MLPEYRGTPHLGYEPIKAAVNGRVSAMELGTGLEYTPQFPHIFAALEVLRLAAVEKHNMKQSEKASAEKLMQSILA